MYEHQTSYSNTIYLDVASSKAFICKEKPPTQSADNYCVYHIDID